MTIMRSLIFCFAVTFACLSLRDDAAAQPITVVVDTQFQQAGQNFVAELKASLPNPERDTVTFETRLVTPAEIASVLRAGGWHLAVVSTSSLAGISTRNTAATFEIPFLFPSTKSAIDLQNSPVGLAGLGTSMPEGVSGLVYLNAGLNLLTTKTRPRTSFDLKGAKVGVNTAAQQKTLESLGGRAVMLPSTDVANALRSGNIDAGVLTSANPGTWHLTDVRYILTDSIKAQVALVATHDATWDRLAFPLRAKLGDAAVAATRRRDAVLVEAEASLVQRAQQANVAIVAFEATDAAAASRQWIGEQPAALREGYERAYTAARRPDGQRPTAPTPTRRAATGKIYFATTRDATADPTIAYSFDDRATNAFNITCGEIGYVAPGTLSSAQFTGQRDTGIERCGARMNTLLVSGRPMLIFVHGFNNRFSDAVERGLILKDSVGADMDVLIWSWPSKRDGITGNYYYDKEAAGGNSRQAFLEFLKTLKSGATSKPVNILAHSLGSWHTMNVLTGLSNDNGRPQFGNIALAAPDIAVNEFRGSLSRLQSVSRRVSLYACGSDHALAISRSWHDFERAGTGGDDIVIDNQNLESIDVEGRWLSSNHSYVFEAGKVLDDLKALVSVDQNAQSRGLSKMTRPAGFYWTFP